jgi:superoxide dismutase, Fe-Mn family
MKIKEFIIMPQTIEPQSLIHLPGHGPNNRFDFKNNGNNRANESVDMNSKLELVKLPYKLDELSPVLSKENVDYHYNVLSAGYVKRFNDREGDSDFNRGGAMLHNLFWAQLQKPKSSNNPVGEVKTFIESNFKTFNEFKEQLLSSAMSIQGSGWVYLAKNGSLKTTPNQSYKTDILMPIDMWEHSFTDYVPATDAKKRYIVNIMRIINWDIINHRLSTLKEDAAGVGIITKQNTTADVKPGETQRQAAKFGFKLDRKGIPPRHGEISEQWQAFKENFADGKVKGKSRPGRVKRAGASCKGSVASLRSNAKKYGGEKGKMYRWCANMKSGRKRSR